MSDLWNWNSPLWNLQQLSRRVLSTHHGALGAHASSLEASMYPLWQWTDLLTMEELVSALCLWKYIWRDNNLYGSSWSRLNPSWMDCWRKWFGRCPSWSTNEPGPSIFFLLSKVGDLIPSSALSRLFWGMSIRSRTVPYGHTSSCERIIFLDRNLRKREEKRKR